jgi:hypothetical protein
MNSVVDRRRPGAVAFTLYRDRAIAIHLPLSFFSPAAR